MFIHANLESRSNYFNEISQIVLRDPTCNLVLFDIKLVILINDHIPQCDRKHYGRVIDY